MWQQVMAESAVGKTCKCSSDGLRGASGTPTGSFALATSTLSGEAAAAGLSLIQVDVFALKLRPQAKHQGRPSEREALLAAD